MKTKQWRRCQRALLLAGVVLFLLSAQALAVNGRDFAGFYWITDVVPIGDEYAITMNVEIFNFGEEDVNYGTVSWVDSLLASGPYAETTAIYLPMREKANLTLEAIIPARDYAQWQEGGVPYLEIDYLDSIGDQIIRPVELAPEPALEVIP